MGKLITAIAIMVFWCAPLYASNPPASLWDFWDVRNDANPAQIDHSAWDRLLSKYVVTNHESGINRFRYADFSAADAAADRKTLDRYIDQLVSLDPRPFSSNEQLAYWLNLYNALTVRQITEHFPVTDLRDLRFGFMSRHDFWSVEMAQIARQSISLNDIEHRILRPIWKDHRVRFGIACGALSCPNLQPQAFTGETVRAELYAAAGEYINHSRGVRLENGQLTVSSLFDWYREDFAPDDKTLVKLFAHYKDDRSALYLLGFNGDIEYNYNWALNAP